MKRTDTYFSLVVGAGLFVLLCHPFPTFAATAPTLDRATSFAVIAASGGTTTGPSVIGGDLGISPDGASSITLSKAFTPATIIPGGVSTLTVTLGYHNPLSVALLIVPLIDTLPSGVVIAATPNLTTTCITLPGVAYSGPRAEAGGSTVTLPLQFDPAGSGRRVVGSLNLFRRLYGHG